MGQTQSLQQLQITKKKKKMQSSLFVCVTLLVLGCASYASAKLSEEAASFLLQERFEKFKETFQKKYKDEDEEYIRLKNFEKNFEKAVRLNAELRELGHDEVHGVTKFSDMTEDEFSRYQGLEASGDDDDPLELEVLEENLFGGDLELKGSFNWKDEGKLTAVKDQGACGSCWAFAAVETIEAARAIHGEDLTEYSPQQLVSCSKSNHGCAGGNSRRALEYVKWSGISKESDYPYTSGGSGEVAKCRDDIDRTHVHHLDWKYATFPCLKLRTCTEQSAALAKALKQFGPIIICVDASNWGSYTGGIMDHSSCSSKPSQSTHTLQIVGYDADADTPYWIARNSWNENWGEGGYIRLKMGGNVCGFANRPTVIKKAE